jgi:hypothetical protein
VIDKQTVEYLKLLHGSYNTIVMLLFFYHGRLGLLIRKKRMSGAPPPMAAVKRHRKAGPVLAVAGALGFFMGFTVTVLDKGDVLAYPLHFFTGSAIVLLLMTTYALSRKIKGPDSPFRTPHFIIGTAILLLYLTQSFLGLGILL